MANFNKHYAFVENVAEKVHNLQSDDLRVLLTNAAPTTANAIKSDLTEIGAGNGYTAGGTAASQTSSAQSSGLYKLVCADVTFTASGGDVGPFEFADFYNNTPTAPSKPLIGWWDYGSAITLHDTESFTVDFSAVNGVLTIQ
jgi:hypothetical protein